MLKWLCGIVFLFSCASGLTADDSAAWRSLPGDTVAAVRGHDFHGWLAELRQHTKLGKVLLSEERMKALYETIKNSAGANWTEATSELGKYGLKAEDLFELGNGEFGLGLTASPREGRKPQVSILVWFECGEEFGDRLMTALDRVTVEQNQKDPPETRRVDVEVDGKKIIQIRALDYDKKPVDVPRPANWDELDLEAKRQYWELRRKKREEAPLVQVDQHNVLIHRAGKRFLIATTADDGRAFAEKQMAAGAEVDFDEVAGTRVLMAQFVKFIGAHAAGGDPAGMVSGLAGQSGRTAALPKGRLVADFVFDFGKAFELLAAREFGAEENKLFDGIGLTNLHAVSGRMTSEGNQLRFGGFAALPSPRRGMWKLAEQQPLPATAPAWLPAATASYSHLSFDFAQAFDVIKSIALQVGGPEAETGFARADMMFAGQVGVGIREFLGSIGRRISITALKARKPKSPLLIEAMASSPNVSDRTILAVELNNDEVWKKLLAMAKTMAGSAGGVTYFDAEQGFSGARMEQPLPLSVLLGHGYLVVVVGEDTEIMASFANPAASGSRIDALLAKAASAMTLRPSISFQIADGDGFASWYRVWREIFFDDFIKTLPDEQKALAALVPTAAEVDKVLGVGVSQVYLNDDGLVVEGVQVLGNE